MILSLFAVGKGAQGFVVTAVSVITRDLALASLVLFFLWRNREPLTAIGWTSKDWMQQAGLGVLLYPLVFLGVGFFASLLEQAGAFSSAFAIEGGTVGQKLVAGPLGHSTGRGRRSDGRDHLSRLSTPAFFGHQQESVRRHSSLDDCLLHGARIRGRGGNRGRSVAWIGVCGYLLANGSLIAPIVMHFLQDFFAVVVVPLFTNGQ